MNEEKYIAAIEIGSSKISGAVGRVRSAAPDVLEILAVETERATEIVSHGIIQNLEAAGSRISNIVRKLEDRIRTKNANRKIQNVFVGLNGRSLRNIQVEISRDLPDDTEITDSNLSSLRLDALNYHIDSSLEVRDAIPGTFVINNTETRNPIGICGNRITARYNLIVCKPLLSRHIKRVVQDKAMLGIARYVVTPLALADLVLKSDEKKLGCMLVDMGAETTTVSLYKDNNLVYLAVLPMGSRNITLDITSLNVLEDKAEDIKTTSGSAVMTENQSNLNIGGVRMSDVANRVVARSEEIVANIVEQIKYAGLSESQLPGGITIAGGGFHLKRMADLLRDSSGMNVIRAQMPSSVKMEDTQASAYDCLQLVAIMNAGLKNDDIVCVQEIVREELPAIGTYVPEDEPREEVAKPADETPSRHRGSLWNGLNRLSSKISNIFVPGDDDDDDTELD